MGQYITAPLGLKWLLKTCGIVRIHEIGKHNLTRNLWDADNGDDVDGGCDDEPYDDSNDDNEVDADDALDGDCDDEQYDGSNGGNEVDEDDALDGDCDAMMKSMLIQIRLVI